MGVVCTLKPDTYHSVMEELQLHCSLVAIAADYQDSKNKITGIMRPIDSQHNKDYYLPMTWLDSTGKERKWIICKATSMRDAAGPPYLHLSHLTKKVHSSSTIAYRSNALYYCGIHRLTNVELMILNKKMIAEVLEHYPSSFISYETKGVFSYQRLELEMIEAIVDDKGDK